MRVQIPRAIELVGCLFSIAFIMGGIPSGSLAATDPAAGSAVDVAAQAIDQLESNQYAVRVRATETLVRLGQEAIEPVRDAAKQGGLETTSRCVYVLRKWSLSDDDPSLADAAYDALSELANSRLTGAARRANAARQTVHEVRKAQAKNRLTRVGAVLTNYPVTVPLQNTAVFPCVQITPRWRGKRAELDLLRWITKPLDAETEAPWMIILEGKQVRNDWVELVANLENVAVIKIREASVDDDAVKMLKNSNSLQILELLYNPITDESFEQLAGFQNVDRFRLIGNEMTEAANKEFEQRVAPIEVDFRLGGFLGVGCEDAPCRVTRVQPNSAAETAGFVVGDVIVKYNGFDVSTMTELTALIAKHKATQETDVVIRRGGELIERKVTLGKWD